ncbi:ribosome biogenesis protein NOP53 [Solenopsis invicta]|uniref:ribosome biogenesis protein NOP53 n=1 Tax=Solenopsis invicta TaxID=13686 RepID=UPI000595EBE4|nr:ribosome biogenesis protein NOP53 [Solenopsis invicta]XP_025995809.1 ribosome biogenesis protein NOP53 [Solenopsis invicta]XP_025995811.1 ribosome biogenesis protein NOP53 [Solenopsis invicta]XP_025995812.1 ribosome biogenesis protein NOP53 [Solenopsis invicta]XP_039310649.1 ribosome biogenesis protein NOP53 [Solenopsis invicta]XP_039310651.1 ribosome biogenesis protein NOP53 [Solenopsis invicta]XP_039310652.1 ribosome biogenesis protein NOP53 [Solenopsis invicta]
MFDVKVKKHKVSKKTKRSWRKYSDVQDIDAFLDNNRLEERLGVPFSERTDLQLFTIDKTAINATRNTTSKRATRLALKNKEPRCFVSLKAHTCVPDPISKRNRVSAKKERINSVLQHEREKKIKNILQLKEKKALKNILRANTSVNCSERGEIKDDIWNGTNILLPETVMEWMSSDSVRHTIKYLGVTKRKLPSSLGKKPSILSAVEMPHPGTSYNPSYNDHQKLLNEVAKKELELIKKEEHLDRVTTRLFQKISLKKQEENMMKEMSEGLSKNCITLNYKSDHDQEDSAEKTNSKSVKNNKKTLVQKRKQREQKQAVKERTLVKLEKKKVSDIYKLKVLQKEIEAKEKKQEFLRQKRIKKYERESLMPKTLSRTKFEPIDPDFQLAEELTGNLRNCKPSKNLLKERYKSLQQRNIIAPAVIKLKRDKAKMKKFIKPDYKINLDDIEKSTTFSNKNRI